MESWRTGGTFYDHLPPPAGKEAKVQLLVVLFVESGSGCSKGLDFQ